MATKFIKHNSLYVNTNNIAYFEVKMVVKYKKIHEIKEVPTSTVINKEEMEIQRYVINIFFIGDDKEMKMNFTSESEVNHFISNLNL